MKVNTQAVTTRLSLLLTRKWMFFIFAGLGLLLLFILVLTKPTLAHKPQDRVITAVSIVNLSEKLLRPTVTGFGRVEPDLSLQAKAEVSGRIEYVHPQLEKGALLPAGTLLLRIDEHDYHLQLKQAEAELVITIANVDEVKLRIENNAQEIRLAEEKLRVNQHELARLRSLVSQGSVSVSLVDKEQQNVLGLQQALLQLKNLQRTLPSELAVLEAKQQSAQASVARAQRDLSRTHIRLPFNARISKVYVDTDQFVPTGADLFRAVGFEKMLINAQFPIEQFKLFSREFDPTAFMSGRVQKQPSLNMQTILQKLELQADVSLASGEFKTWTATVERISDALDPQTNTLGVIVSVEGSYAQLEPGIRPPLLEGMYMQVTLKGKPKSFVALPRYAVNGNEVFVVDNASQLQRVKLGAMLSQDEVVLLRAEDAQSIVDSALIVSDVFPAVSGMSVNTHIDHNAQEQLARWIEQNMSAEVAQ